MIAMAPPASALSSGKLVQGGALVGGRAGAPIHVVNPEVLEG